MLCQVEPHTLPPPHPSLTLVSLLPPFQFATFTNGNLQLATTPAFPRTGSTSLPVASACLASGCTNCLQPARGITLAYKPGDVLVAALVDAHGPGQQGLNCGDVIPDRLMDAVAARFGANRASATIGRGVTMGYLIVDVCPGEWEVVGGSFSCSNACI